jgi:DNA-binding response OmpR family regulator
MRLATKARLLVVEDDPVLARTIGRALSALGISVVCAGTCGAGRSAEGLFDGGVFDIDLPDGDGITLAEDLLRAGVVSTAVFFSGRSETDVVGRARALGRFVPKTAGVSKLLETVADSVAESMRAMAAGGGSTPVGESSYRWRSSGIRRRGPR